MSAEYIQSVIDNHGVECGNCGEFRILKSDTPFYEQWPDDLKNIIETCPNCGDEAYDIYEMSEAGP
jgi:predicted RNA-binding Zn-ribbon protein involved in translation (DUF1610 family)